MSIALGSMRRALIVATAAFAAMVSTAARGAIIDNGGLQFPAATVPAPSAGATLVADTGPVAVVAQTFSGSVQSQVYSNDANNALNGNTFVYRITNGSGSPNSIERATIDSFAGFLTDVGYVSGAGVHPGDANRGSNGDIIGFDFKPFPQTAGTAIAAGQTTDLLVIRTNSPSFVPSTLTLIDGSAGTATSFAPAAVIPEPAGVSLLLCAAAAGVLARRRGAARVRVS